MAPIHRGRKDDFNVSEAILNTFASVAIAYATAKFTLRHDKERKIYAKREAIYLELFDLVSSLQNCPDDIYADKYYQQLVHIRAKLNLFASSELCTLFEQFYSETAKKYKQYGDLFCSLEREHEEQDRKEYDNATEDTFRYEEELYAKEHRFSDAELSDYLLKMVSLMRHDIGTGRNLFGKVSRWFKNILNNLKQFGKDKIQKGK